jgi:hypothetical protein
MGQLNMRMAMGKRKQSIVNISKANPAQRFPPLSAFLPAKPVATEQAAAAPQITTRMILNNKTPHP